MNTPLLNTYLNLCTQVYDLSKPVAPEDAYAVYRSYALQANGSILEPMCGTGRFLLPLLAEGFDIMGFDASDHMLSALHTKAQSRHLKPTVWRGLVADLDRTDKYNLIFIPSGSFGLITDLEEAKTALKIFYSYLNAGGTLVFEVETLKSGPIQHGLWRASIWQKEDGNHILANFLDLPLVDNVGTTICKYELIDSNQIIHTEIEELKVRIYDPKHLMHILQDVGFKKVHTIKAFNRSKIPDENDEVILFECIK